jgi:hypothetical protein
MAALIDRDTRRRLKQPRSVTLLGADLANAKEEAFCLMVMDGLSIGLAFAKAGFTSKATDAPYILFRKPHIQARAQAILEARRTQGVITLPEVTSMLQRVFAGALHDAEYSAAHNAAFSLARIYGHVTDRATLEVVRRPSRDPDAPSEMALSAWVEALPGLPGPGLEGPSEARFVRLPDAPAAPLGHDIQGPGPEKRNEINWLASSEPSLHHAQGPRPEGPGLGLSNEINGLEGSATGGRPENGAPTRPVTGTPVAGAHSELLGPGGQEKRGPMPEQTGTSYPRMEDLF